MVRPTEEEVKKVHKFIEYCITKYKTKKETMEFMASKANINPIFTKIIWEELEQQNSNFFKEYYKRLLLIHQINRFNSLLQRQAELMQRNGLRHQNQLLEPMQQQQYIRNGLRHQNQLRDSTGARFVSSSPHTRTSLMADEAGSSSSANLYLDNVNFDESQT